MLAKALFSGRRAAFHLRGPDLTVVLELIVSTLLENGEVDRILEMLEPSVGAHCFDQLDALILEE